MNVNLFKPILKTALPMVKPLIADGKLDGYIADFKRSVADKHEAEDCEIILSTEDDGKIYVSFVLMAECTIIKILEQVQLSAFVSELLNKIEKNM